MGPQPGSQQGPKTFPRVDRHFVKSIAIVVAGRLLLAVIDGVVFVAPVLQSRVDVVLVGKDRCPELNRGFQKRCDCRLLNVRQPVENDLTRTLNPPQDGWLLFCQSASTAITFPSPTMSLPPVV